MLLVLDESGDDGLVVRPGHSPWLVIGGLLFADTAAALACRAALDELRKKHGGKEFHFRNNNPARRALVLDCLAASAMTYFAVACDKSRLTPGRWRKPVDLFHALAAEFVTVVLAGRDECTVWFDTLGGRDVDREYGRHLQRSAGKLPTGRALVRDWKAHDSSKELLIQAADYVCGAVAKSVKSDAAEPHYRATIRRREGRVWFWPAGDEEESGASRSEERPFNDGS